MNENNITVMARPVEEDEIEINLLDMLAEFLLKWKKILALFLIGAIIGCGAALIKNSGLGETKKVTSEDISAAKEELNANEVMEAETLFLQYKSYKELQRDVITYWKQFTESLDQITEENTMQLRRKYYVASDIENLGDIVGAFALTEATYDALREIAPDTEAGARIYDRVSIGSWKGDRITVANMTEEESAPIQYLFTITVTGNSEDQCEAMMHIVDQAFLDQLDSLKAIDPDQKATFAGEDYNRNMLNYANNLRKSRIDSLTSNDKELKDLSDKVAKLGSDEKAYYELLKKQYDQEFTPEEKVSLKKWTVIGAFLGAVAACCAVFLPYLMDGKIKSAGELEQSGKLLNRVFIQGKKNLFGKWAARLIHADDMDPALKADMVATDLAIQAEKNEKKNLMLLYSREDADAAGFAEQVRVRLQEKNGDLKVNVGNPLHSVEELEMAAQADMGVVFAEMKKSRRAMLREWRQICERYKLPLAGAVAVQRCW